MLPKKLGIEWKDDFAVDDAPVWKCLLKGGVNSIYARLVKNSDRPKCLDKWSKELNTEVDVKEAFGRIFKNIHDSCLRWFIYKLLYRFIPTCHFLFLRKMVNSPRCFFL